MELLLTYYVSADEASVKERLDRAVRRGIAATVDLSPAATNGLHTEAETFGMRVRGETELDGSEIRVSATNNLTTLQVAIPWHENDSSGSKLRAASRFAAVVADDVALAA